VCPLQGEAVTWQKLSAIQAACGIELTFDKCLAMVKAAEATERENSLPLGSGGRRGGGMRSRIPSWSCMAAACAPLETLTSETNSQTLKQWHALPHPPPGPAWPPPVRPPSICNSATLCCCGVSRDNFVML